METQNNESHGSSRRDFFRTTAIGAAVGAATVTGVGAAVCALNPAPKPIVESTLGKAVRRVKQSFLPTQASVRWDGAVKQWAVLDKNLKPVRHFTHGILTDVKFRSESVTTKQYGCGGGNSLTTNYAGIAEGMLVENKMGSDHLGYRNLKFKEGHFLTYQDEKIHNAPVVVLLPDRHAIYKEA